MFRSQILPGIVALWGATIVINMLLTGTDGSGAYSGGQLAGAAAGVVMVVLGARAVLKARLA